MAFESMAFDLVPGGGSPTTNVFVRDMEVGTNYLVSVSTNGTSGNRESFNPTFSPDGRWVLVQSRAYNLVSISNLWGLAQNGGFFARDLNANRTIFLSELPRNLGPSVSRSDSLALSADSRWRRGLRRMAQTVSAHSLS